MHVKETELGNIEYRFPNIAEGPLLMGQCGINSKKAQDKKWLEDNELIIIAKVIKNMGQFVTKIEVEGAKTFKDLLEMQILREPVYEIAGEILSSLGVSEEKK